MESGDNFQLPCLMETVHKCCATFCIFLENRGSGWGHIVLCKKWNPCVLIPVSSLIPYPHRNRYYKSDCQFCFFFTRESKFQECFQSFVSFLEVIKVTQFCEANYVSLVSHTFVSSLFVYFYGLPKLLLMIVSYMFH